MATYIPELAHADPRGLGAALAFPSGRLIEAGEAEAPFTLQSIVKIPLLALALVEFGFDEVFSRVGMEPTGDPFHSIARLELQEPDKPQNPMINAGAIAVCGLLESRGGALDRLRALIGEMSGGERPAVDQDVFESEWESGHKNRALAYFLANAGALAADVETTLRFYFQACALQTSARHAARMGLCLAMGGAAPQGGGSVLPAWVASVCQAIMFTCGMYDASGEFAVRVGLPAKSGVSGGVMAAVPQRMGAGAYGPALDERGNSLGGVRLLEHLSRSLGLHIFGCVRQGPARREGEVLIGPAPNGGSVSP